MSDRVTFGAIHRLLAHFGFERGRVEGKPFVVFEQKASGVVFMFRPHRSNERIDATNLESVRLHLVQNGFLSEDEFEEELNRVSRAGTAKEEKK
jgi:hypothetical protein